MCYGSEAADGRLGGWMGLLYGSWYCSCYYLIYIAIHSAGFFCAVRLVFC